MYITLQDKHEYTPDFLNFVKQRMYIKGLDYLNKNRSKLIKTDLYISDLMFDGVRKSSTYQIIIYALRNILIKKASSKVIISINDSLKAPYNDDYTLSKVCQLIDQGNLEINPFPIFTYIFEYVQNNITQIYCEYSFGVPI